MFVDKVSDVGFVVRSARERIGITDFRVGFTWINFGAVNLRQQACHEQPHPSTIAKAAADILRLLAYSFVFHQGPGKISRRARESPVKDLGGVADVPSQKASTCP